MNYFPFNVIFSLKFHLMWFYFQLLLVITSVTMTTNQQKVLAIICTLLEYEPVTYHSNMSSYMEAYYSKLTVIYAAVH